MDYENGAVRIGLLESLLCPIQSLVPRWREEDKQINLTGIFNFPRESVSLEEAASRVVIHMILIHLLVSWKQQNALTNRLQE